MRREKVRDATREEIKAIARRQMAAQGTAGLSLSQIAAEMGVKPPALYRYYDSRDALITALIVDAFEALAQSLAEASAALPKTEYAARLLATTLEYRQWALRNTTDFELIYGSPIPGYVAPDEITIPAALKSYRVILDVMREAWRAGALVLPKDYMPPPSTVWEPAAIYENVYLGELTPEMLHIGIEGWTIMHGYVMLEIHGHFGGMARDSDALYRHEMLRYMLRYGMTSA